MTNAKEVYLTSEGLQDLKQELENLKLVKRPEVIQALKEARALGDLSENAEYDAARHEQAVVESRIVELEQMIENAVVIDTFGGSGSTLMTCEQTNRICHTMELDEKYASVILRRYVEDTDDAENVYVIRNGEKLMYSDLVKEVDFGDGTTE